MQRFIAGLLLLMFAFSITPKRFLHNAFAKHIDNKAQKTNSPVQLTVSGYNCDTDNLVAESNFVGSQYTYQVHHSVFYLSYSSIIISFSSSFVTYSSLRGPPVNI